MIQAHVEPTQLYVTSLNCPVEHLTLVLLSPCCMESCTLLSFFLCVLLVGFTAHIKNVFFISSFQYDLKDFTLWSLILGE